MSLAVERGRAPLRVVIADDEAPARTRLKHLLEDIATIQPTELVGFAANGVEALRLVEAGAVDLVLADIRMPVMDGIELARHLGRAEPAPAVVFTTAYDEYAVKAFDLAAVDYLLKPVRAERLAAALAKACAHRPPSELELRDLPGAVRHHFSVNERGRILLVPVDEVLFLRAEQKYVTAVTAARDYLLDESLVQLEQEFERRFVRTHRSCLVARDAVAGVEQVNDGHWEVLLKSHPARLPVSRRQWPAVRQALGL